MEANEDAKKDIAGHHWRSGSTKSPGGRKAGKDIHGLSKEKRAEIEEIKSSKDHPTDDDPFSVGE